MHWAGAASSGQVELKASAARGIWGMPWPGCLGGMAGAGVGVLEHLKGMGYCWHCQGHAGMALASWLENVDWVPTCTIKV